MTTISGVLMAGRNFWLTHRMALFEELERLEKDPAQAEAVAQIRRLLILADDDGSTFFQIQRYGGKQSLDFKEKQALGLNPTQGPPRYPWLWPAILFYLIGLLSASFVGWLNGL